MAKGIDRMKKALTDKKESEKPVEENQSSGARDLIKGMKKRGTEKKEYSPFRMKTETYDKMKAIAEREDAVWPGQLIHTVLNNFIEKYEKENDIQL